MTGKRRAVVELVAAVVALAGAALSAANVCAIVDVAPITAGEPPTTSVTYSPPALVLTLLLVTVAGVLVVVGAARWRRSS
ncbi:hypothetical protein [Mycolicibacterium mengxianglii]|uniref:hypothetical protein n=1 Tax=Mycolicibacterium mengxianglii TaxID=2736649 RepID=UPI0018D0B32E|nr:hypothetical protein [Mycolicibacterium mengxianglii]